MPSLAIQVNLDPDWDDMFCHTSLFIPLRWFNDLKNRLQEMEKQQSDTDVP